MATKPGKKCKCWKCYLVSVKLDGPSKYVRLYCATDSSIKAIEWSPKLPKAISDIPWQFCPYCGEPAEEVK